MVKAPRPRRRGETATDGQSVQGAPLNSRDQGSWRKRTRILAIFITPFLLLAFGILYLLPDHTHELFAWTIKPRMTAMMLGAAYLGGAYFFIRTATARHWHMVQAGFLPVVAFAGTLGITTILHWDRFNHHHIAFFAWTALYFTTPFLVLAIWLLNRNSDVGETHAESAPLPNLVRNSLVAVGIGVSAVATITYISPSISMAIWPWDLTPLTARVLASLFAVGGTAMLCVGLYRRWSCARITLQSQVVSLTGVEIGVAFSWANFHHHNPLTWIFTGGLLVLVLAVAPIAFWPKQQAGAAKSP